MGYRLGHGYPGGAVGRATLGALAGSSGGQGALGDATAARAGISYGTCEGVRADGKAYVLLDGASGVLTLPVAAELPLALLVSRRVVVAGDDPVTWLVVGLTGTSVLNVANGLAQLDAAGKLATAMLYTNVPGGVAQLDGAGDLPDAQLSANVARLNVAQNWAAQQSFFAGAEFGLGGTTDVRTQNMYIPRLNRLNNILMLDYQDEFALLTSEAGRSATLSPAPSTGSVASVFVDDAAMANYNAGTSPFPIVLEVDCLANPIPSRNNSIYRMALTYSSNPLTQAGTGYTIELWDTPAGAWVQVQAGTLTQTAGVVLLPQFQALVATSFRIDKLRLTLTGTNPLPAGNTLRLQRVILYHNTHTWDPWHLHRVGGTVLGNVGIGAGVPAVPTSVLQVAGPIATAVAAKTAAYTLGATDSVIAADATGGAFTLTLPTAVGIAGRMYTIKRTSGGINNVTVDANGAQLIDGALTFVLTAQWQTVRLVSDNVGWLVV